jgi:uncharacterized protein YndB with AHSA1/START domain
MEPIQVKVFFEAPRERVFEAVSDHEHFFTGNRIESCRIIQPGREEKNGLGALREVKAGPVRYVEEITVFERPHRFAYQIRECSRPLRHEGSELEFVSRGQGTEVTWTARFEVPIFPFGPLLTWFMRQALTKEFERLLVQAKGKLEPSDTRSHG